MLCIARLIGAFRAAKPVTMALPANTTQQLEADKRSPKEQFLKSIGATRVAGEIYAYELAWMKEADVRFLDTEENDVITLSKIKSATPNQGIGSACLQWLLEKADKAGISVDLIDAPLPNIDDNISWSKLTSWYEYYGFERDPDDEDFLIRYPQPSEL